VIRQAIIDIGSNSLKMYVGRVVHGRVTEVADMAVVNRLAEGLAGSGELSEAAMDRTLVAIKEFKAHAEGLGAEKIAAVGTQALRQADNAKEFVTWIRNRCKIGVRVLSGAEEARLAFLAATSSLDLGDDPVQVFDAGGASTEVVQGIDGRIDESCSLPVGSRVLTDRHLLSDPVTVAELAELSDALRRVIETVPVRSGKLVGIGATAVSLGTVHYGVGWEDHAEVHGRTVSRRVVEAAIGRLREMSLRDRRRIPGLHPQRADVMLAGASIVAALMSRLGTDDMIICDRGLRHGVFHDRFVS